LHPVILEPMSAEQATRTRRWLWVVITLLAYTGIAWLATAVGTPR
jgi:hypothetical protein